MYMYNIYIYIRTVYRGYMELYFILAILVKTLCFSQKMLTSQTLGGLDINI